MSGEGAEARTDDGRDQDGRAPRDPSHEAARGAPQPVRPPVARRMTGEAARLARAAGRARAALPLGAGGASLRLDPLGTADFSAASAVTLSIDDRRLSIALSAAAHERLAAAAGLALDAPSKDPAFAALALEAACAAGFDVVEAALGRAVRADSWATAPRGAPAVWVAAEIDFEDVDGASPVVARAALGVDMRSLATMTDLLERAPRRPDNDGALRAPGRLCFPGVTMALGEVMALRPGDVVLDDFSYADLRFAIGAARWRCAMADDPTVKIEQRERVAPPPDEAAEGGDPFESAQVELVVELARVALPLDEARSIAPGYVAPLGRRIGPEVDVMVSGRRFARARLVDVDGELGVEILRVL